MQTDTLHIFVYTVGVRMKTPTVETYLKFLSNQLIPLEEGHSMCSESLAYFNLIEYEWIK